MTNPYKSDKFRFIIGLILIVLIYSAYYLYFVDNISMHISRRTKHVGSFLTTIIIYFVGTLHLGKLSDSWMTSVWHLVHVSGLCILTLLGLYDWIINELSLSLRSFAQSIQETLISPVLYVGMGLINTSFKKK